MNKSVGTMPVSINTSKTPKVHNELFEGYSDELITFAAATCILFAVVGVPSNLLTIIALLRGKQNRNSTAIFIINLSLSDLLFGCIILPLAASTFLQRSWNHSELLCRLFPLLQYGLLAVSLLTVSLITINRYIIIAHPRQYPRIYQRRYLVMMVAGAWIAAFATMIPTWRGLWGTFGLDTDIGSCSILRDKNNRTPKEFLFVIAFLVPCICIVFCYTRIFYLVRKAAFRTREPAKNISFLSEKTAEPPTIKNTAAKIDDNGAKLMPKVDSDVEDDFAFRPFLVDEVIEYIDLSDSNDSTSISCSASNKITSGKNVENSVILEKKTDAIHNKDATKCNTNDKSAIRPIPIKTSLKTSFTRFNSRKTHYISTGNTSNASSIYAGKMSQKDRRLLKIIFVIFVSFVICYLPITITKIWKNVKEMHVLNISGYLLIYLTTCINPFIYVLMSSEYRQAYWSLLRCQNDLKKKDFNRVQKT